MAGMQGATALVLQCSPLPRFDPDLRGVLEAHCPPGDDISFILKFMHNHSDEPDASSIRAQARQFKTEYSTPKHLYKYQASVCILDYFSGDEATFEKYRPVASKDVAHRSKSLCVCEPYYGLSLHDYILQRSLKPDLSAIRGLSCEEWYAMITGVFFCVQSLEREGIAHCDIKPKNVVYSPRFGPLLIDFGGAQVFRAPGSSSGISIDPSQTRLAHMCSPRYCDPYVTAFGSGDCHSPPTTMEGLFGKADAYSAAKSMLDVIFGNTSWVCTSVGVVCMLP
jgi:serine/threonine protein kinase